METTARDGATSDARHDSAMWRATAEVLACELAALQRRLATVERALGLPTPPIGPSLCRCQFGRAEHDIGGFRRVPPSFPGGLSRREAEVLALLAAGRSNGQIAQALCLSPRTVQRHVANAYLKIGAHNKAEATAYAMRHRLA